MEIQTTLSSTTTTSNDASPGLSISDNKIEVNGSDVYDYTLKLLLLDYINEPKFQRKAAYPSSYISDDNGRKHSNHGETPRSMNILDNKEELRIISLLKQRLAKYLYDVTINKQKANNAIFRRCLLKLNNDLFLNNDAKATLDHIQKPEELIVYFTKAANNELNKLSIDDIQKELYKHVSSFIELLSELLPSNAPITFKQKLREYKESMKSNKPKYHRLSRLHNQFRVSSSPSDIPTTQTFRTAHVSSRRSTAPQEQPSLSYKLEEIPYMEYFCNIFKVDKIQVQQDVIRFIDDVSNFTFCKELNLQQEKIKNDVGSLRPKDWDDINHYFEWKQFQLQQIQLLLEKFQTFGRNPKTETRENVIVPAHPREIYTSLMGLVLDVEYSENKSSLSLSKQAFFFLQKSAKYWGLNYPSTTATLLYTATNLNILTGEELNIPLIENLFDILKVNIFLIEQDDIDSANWNGIDRTEWATNISHTAKQCINELNDLLSALYARTKPKFSAVLAFYYTYIESDMAYMLHSHNSEHKIVKQLRRTIFKTSEYYYKGLLMDLPKDDSLELKNVQNIAELILSQIQSIQKKYTKPLLDKVNIAFECATMLISAIAIDGPFMIKKIEVDAIAKNKTIPSVDALEAYSVFKELRNIYTQVQPKEEFPFKLEKTFGKYLKQFADDVSVRLLKAFERAVKDEKWERISADTPYSYSVLDVFKMANESLGLFRNFDWDPDYKYAVAVTTVLKAFSTGIQYYCDTALKVVQDSLNNTTDELPEITESNTTMASEKRRSRWDFAEMKKALSSSAEIALPTPYKYNPLTCVIENNIDTMIKMIEDLESGVNATELSEIIVHHERTKDKKSNSSRLKALQQLYTIRVKGARDIKGYGSNGLSNSCVSLTSSELHKEIGETKTYSNSNDPIWDEEFEVSLNYNGHCTIIFTVWHRPLGRFKSFRRTDVCGRAILVLSPKEFVDDGFPTPRTLLLDTKGDLNVEISLETEKLDPLFCIGRSYRTLTRTRDRILELIVNKFTPFVSFAFSRDILRSICGSNGYNKPSDDEAYDALVPLFDYLNANLNVLAQQLTQDLLFMVMLKAWHSLLIAADILLLPQADIAKHKLAHAKNSLWNKIGSNDIMGYGRPLTTIEVDIILRWMDYLCVDFFYNNGEGPPLEDLKNSTYQTLLLIPKYYTKSSVELKQEIKKLNPIYYKHMGDLGNTVNVEVSRRLTTVERRKTIMENSSKARRKQFENREKNIKGNNVEMSLAALDIILRIILSRGDMDYVYRELHQRKKEMKKITVQNLVNKVSSGQKIQYKS